MAVSPGRTGPHPGGGNKAHPAPAAQRVLRGNRRGDLDSFRHLPRAPCFKHPCHRGSDCGCWLDSANSRRAMAGGWRDCDCLGSDHSRGRRGFGNRLLRNSPLRPGASDLTGRHSDPRGRHMPGRRRRLRLGDAPRAFRPRSGAAENGTGRRKTPAPLLSGLRDRARTPRHERRQSTTNLWAGHYRPVPHLAVSLAVSNDIL